jgi:hypothetical protein
MIPNSLIKKHWKVTCAIVGCWFFLALLFTPQTYLTNLRSPTPLTWLGAFLATLLLFEVWAVLTPFVYVNLAFRTKKDCSLDAHLDAGG